MCVSNPVSGGIYYLWLKTLTRCTGEMDLPSALNHASQRMGIQGLKPKQLEAIKAFVSGKYTFVSLPTGYGKSIIFAMLPLLFDFLLGKV